MKKRFDKLSIRGVLSLLAGVAGLVYNLWILESEEPFAVAISGIFVLIGLLLLLWVEDHE